MMDAGTESDRGHKTEKREKDMIDGHIHIEQGDYTTDWIRRFADRAEDVGYRIRELNECIINA